MKLGDYQDNLIDAFGNAYEYITSMYASNAGKSGREYYIPEEVSQFFIKITASGKQECLWIYNVGVS